MGSEYVYDLLVNKPLGYRLGGFCYFVPSWFDLDIGEGAAEQLIAYHEFDNSQVDRALIIIRVTVSNAGFCNGTHIVAELECHTRSCTDV